MKNILRRLWLRSFFIQTGFSYQRLQALGWCWVVSPLARVLSIPNRNEFLKRNLEPFNANPYIATYAVGAVAKLEEERKSPAEVERVKNALRGPLGSLGDNLIWNNVRPALLTLGIIASQRGKLWGALLFFAGFNLFQVYLRRRGLKRGYQLGTEVFQEFSGAFWRKIPALFGILGTLALGMFFVLRMESFLTDSLEMAAIFLVAVIASGMGFHKRISALDIFLLATLSGLAAKVAFTLIK